MKYTDYRGCYGWTHSILHDADGNYLGWVWGSGCMREGGAFTTFYYVTGEGEEMCAKTRREAKGLLRKLCRAEGEK